MGSLQPRHNDRLVPAKKASMVYISARFWTSLLILALFAATTLTGAPVVAATTTAVHDIPLTSLASHSSERNLASVDRPASVTSPADAIPPSAQEVASLRSRTSRTYLVNGTYEAIVSSGSLNYADTRGNWVPIDNSVVASSAPGYAWQNRANRFVVDFPSSLAGSPILFSGAAGTVGLKLSGASGQASVSGSSVTYASALPGLTVAFAIENDALKESLVLGSPNSDTNLSYALTLSSGLRVSPTAGGGAAILDAQGRAQFLLDPLTMVDASGNAAQGSAIGLAIDSSGVGQSLSVKASSAWLNDPARVWPVTIDPSINYTSDQDCEIEDSTNANTNLCGTGSSLLVGYSASLALRHRSLLYFNLQSAIPAGAQVTHAALGLYLQSSTGTGNTSLYVYQLTQPWTNAVTWNDYNGASAWSAAGGTYASTLLAQNGAGSGWNYWGSSGIDGLTQAWLSGAAANDGFLVRAQTEAADKVFTFGSTRAGNSPYLVVDYVNAIGERGVYSLDSHQLTDGSHVAVNVTNGNLVISADDLHIKGTGLDLAVSRTYNSLGPEGGAFGIWLMNGGVDEHLSFDHDAVSFQGSGGWDLTFQPNGSGGFTPPPGIDASLVLNGDGSYTLAYASSHEQLNFTSAGVLTSDVDRNGDKISYANSGGNVTSITDTQGRQVTLAYSSLVATNLVSSITDSTGRLWQYSYQQQNGTQELIQYTDPANKSTSYSYDRTGRVSMVTDPLGNETSFGYDGNSRVTSVTRVTNKANGTGPTTSYSYNSGAGTCASPPSADSIEGYTVVTDANSNGTTYCFDPQGLVLQVIDPLSASATSVFTSDQHVAASTDALSQTTTNTFNANNDLTKTTAPVLGSGQTAPTFAATFNTPSTVTGYQFLPSSATDPQGNCTAYLYDSAGNVTDLYQGQVSGCDGKTAGTHTSNRYQGDPGITCGGKTGQLCSATNGNGGQTTYGYDSNGNLTSVAPPSPIGSTTITVDSLSRTGTMTDGKSQKSTYSYDPMDRVTQVLYNGAVQCVPSNGNCITYSYDADGNRIGMVDQSGTTNYYYDALNRLTTQSLPGTGYACAGSLPSGLTFTYDGMGNLLTSCDGGGTTTYGYDKDNRLVSIAEPTGNCGSTPSLCTTFGYNSDGNRTTVTFPGGATQTTGYDNDQNVISVVGKSSTGTTLTSTAYTHVNGANDTPLVQTTTENDAVANNTYSYSYDALNRLTGAAVTSGSGTSYSYIYDSDGNTVSRTAASSTTSYGYNTADQLCWSFSGSSSNACSSAPSGSTAYTFDGNGNLTGNSAGASFSYNTKNQTTAITYGGSTLSPLAYTDGGQQERISAGSTSYINEMGGTGISTSGGSSTHYLIDPSGNVLGERIGVNHYYFLADRLGSVVAVISGDGQTVSDRYGYDPFGSTTYKTVSVANPFGYIGGYTDPTGMIKFGARYYDPATARWSQLDPVADSRSSYVYAAADPINQVDPTGFWSYYFWGGCCWRGSWWNNWWTYTTYFTFYLNQTWTELLLLFYSTLGGILTAFVSAATGLGGAIIASVFLLQLAYIGAVDILGNHRGIIIQIDVLHTRWGAPVYSWAAIWHP